MNEEQQLTQDDNSAFKNFFDEVTAKPAISYLGQLGILIGLFGAALIIGSLIAGGIMVALTHTSIFDIEKTMLNPKYADASRIAQVVSTIIIFFLPVFFYARIVSRKPLQYMGFSNKISVNQLAIIIAITFAGFFLSGALSELNQIIPIPKDWAIKFKKLEDSYNDQVMIMAQMNNWKDYVLSLIVIALFPAIVEESLFRGGLQNILVKWTKHAWIGILITSLLFSAVHISYYGFLSRAMLGMVLGYVFYETKNLWLNIWMHFLNNAFAVTVLFISLKKGKPIKEAMADDNYPLWFGLIALLVIIFLFSLLRKESKKLNPLA